MSARRRSHGEAGFTLLEVLLATLLMTVILGALATVTAQWLPNWSRGIVRVQRAERLAIGLDRVLADLAVVEMMPMNARSKDPLFEGSELAVTFVRSAVGPNTRPGLEIVRMIEKADERGLALVRERAPFNPMPSDAPIRFVDQVVLTRSPFRVTFAYAGPDQVWQPTWHGQAQLPTAVRVSVRDAGTGQLLAVSSAAMVHINAPAECARAKSASACLTAHAKSDADRKDADKKEEQL
jgi:general secretion pathway protein J